MIIIFESFLTTFMVFLETAGEVAKSIEKIPFGTGPD
jgi:hypothetical protein